MSARTLPFDGTSREAYTLLVRQACWLGLALFLAAACGSPSPSAPTRTSAPNINPPVAGPVNRPPSVYLPAFFTIKVPPDSPTLEGFGSIGDPDEGELCGGGNGSGSGVGGCPWLNAVSVSGDCRNQVAVLGCYCLEGLTVDIYRTKPTGTCVVTLTVHDSQGLTATSAFSVTYDQTSGPFKTVSLPQSSGAARAR